MLAFGLRGDVRVVEPGSAKGSKHLSSDLLWSTHDSVMHAVWLYSLWECILTSKCSRRSCPRRLLPLIFCVLPYSGNQKRKTHRIWPTLFWGPGPLRSSPMVRVRVGVRAPTTNLGRSAREHRARPITDLYTRAVPRAGAAAAPRRASERSRPT